MEYNPVLKELGLAPYVPLSTVFQKQGLLQRWVILKKRSTFCSLGQVAFVAAKCKEVPEDIKNNIKWRRRRKKLGYSAKHAAFYTTESLNEPFLGFAYV